MARVATTTVAALLFSANYTLAQSVLTVGQPVQAAITAGSAHDYTIALEAGDYVAGAVDQRGIVVLAAAFTPDGLRLRNFGGPRDGKRTVAFIAERAGTYRLELRAPSMAESTQQGGSQTEKGTYELALLERLSFDERMKSQPPPDRSTSPAIEALRRQIAAGDKSTDAFWTQGAQSGTPLVEPVEGDAKRTWVTFLWRATAQTRNVMVLGSFMTGPPADYAMTHLGDTDVWYLAIRMPSGSRFAYSLSPNDPQTFDSTRAAQRGATVQGNPLNPRRWGCSQPAATRHDCQSMAELPGAPPQPFKSPKLSLKFWMDAGVFEVDSRGNGGAILEPSRHMRDVLLAKGYEVHYQQFNSGHDYLNWRGTLADGLIALEGTKTPRHPRP